jgi:imidazole glycerol-phosphate synthase subunit HisH
MPIRTAIIDYGMGNLDSIRRALEECDGGPLVTASPEDIEQCSHIVLPGVGAFPDGMRNLTARGLDVLLRRQVVDGGVPFLGICLGMQLMLGKGFEGRETAGLGWIAGEVRLLQPANAMRVPHVGWNSVQRHGECALLDGLDGREDFYFVHSYHACCSEAGDAKASTDHGGPFTSVIARNQMFGVQFHPEKSQKSGFRVLRNFLRL